MNTNTFSLESSRISSGQTRPYIVRGILYLLRFFFYIELKKMHIFLFTTVNLQLNVLRQKKRLESDVLKKSNTLDNLSQVLQAIKDAQDNAKVLRSLKQAKDVLFEELKDSIG